MLSFALSFLTFNHTFGMNSSFFLRSIALWNSMPVNLRKVDVGRTFVNELKKHVNVES